MSRAEALKKIGDVVVQQKVVVTYNGVDYPTRAAAWNARTMDKLAALGFQFCAEEIIEHAIEIYAILDEHTKGRTG